MDDYPEMLPAFGSCGMNDVMRLKLLFSAAFSIRSNVGISHYIMRLTPELAQLCDLTVLTPDPECFSENLKVVRIPTYTRRYPGRIAWTACFLSRQFLSRFDALLSPTPVVPVRSCIPAFAVVHDLTPLVFPDLQPRWQREMFRIGLRTLRSARGIVTDSENTRRDLTARFQRSGLGAVCTAYAGPGVAPPVVDRRLAKLFRPYVLYVGGHAPHKNLERLIEAFSKVADSCHHRLILVGWGKPAHVRATARMISLLGIEQRVMILGDTLSDAELSGLYEGCDAFVYPSLYEGFGMPVLEAMAHGAPVVCSRASSIPEVGGDAVLYFDPMSVDEIAQRLTLILRDDSVRSRLRVLGGIRAARFSWGQTAAAIFDFIRNQLSRGASGTRDCLP